MEFTYVRYSEIDQVKWDQCIDKSKKGNLYNYSWYLNSVCNNWGALIHGDYQVIFPLPTKSRFGIPILYQPFFSRFLGIFSAIEPIDDYEQSLFQQLKKHFSIIQINLDAGSNVPPEFRKIERRYQTLDLNHSFDELKGNYRENAKRNIKKAEKKKYQIKEEKDPAIVVEMFRKAKGNKIHDLKSSDYSALLNLMNNCLKRGAGTVITVISAKSQIEASAFFVKHKNTILYLKGSATSRGRANGAMHFLFDHMIRSNANKDIIMDFGGSSISSVAHFYRNFGAIDQEYYEITLNQLSRYVRILYDFRRCLKRKRYIKGYLNEV